MAAFWGERPIEAVLFDKDGTLFDFHQSWGKLGEEVLWTLSAGEPRLMKRLAEIGGYDLGAGRYVAGAPVVVGAISEVVAGWAEELPQWERGELEDWVNRQAEQLSHRGLPTAAKDLPGLLDRLRRAGLKLGVATHDSEAAARAQLETAGALDRFDFIAGYDSGWGLKPRPGMLEAFCQAAGVSAARAAVVGDSLHDLGMGRSGGAGASFGVLTGAADAAHLAPMADAVLGSIEELPAALGV